MKSSRDGASRRCGATWNRDANAAKNLLMLMMLEILEIPRPAAFLAGG
jgi:transposase